MQEQGKNKSLGPKIQEQKKQKFLGSVIMQEQGKGTSLLDEAKNSVRRVKGARVIYASDAERKLDGVKYRLGDMVWAKVKSHPWWPGQLYDPDLASASAMEFRRDSCFLVAFFGDSTFGWFAESEMIPFEPNFAQKSKQTSARNFVEAVEDALDEVRRRGTLGVTCRCVISKSAPESGERKPGLLYDRQLREIRSTFKPAKLVAFVKNLACSPIYFARNTLGSTVLEAQAEAFSLLASRRKVLELEETEVLGDLSQSNQIKAHGPNVSERSKDKFVAEKAGTKKHRLLASSVSSPSQGQEDRIREERSKEQFGGLNRVDKVKQHSSSASPKKRSSKKSDRFHGDKGGIKGTGSKSKAPKHVEDDVQDSRTTSALVSHDALASTAPSLDTFEERDMGESTVFEEGIQNDPTLVATDSLAANQNKALQKKSKKDVGPTLNDVSAVVSEVDATEPQLLPKIPTVVAKKTKVANVEVDKVLKAKVMKKDKVANVEVDKLVKKVKVANVEVDRGFKAKRVAEVEATEVVVASSRKTKKSKLLAETVSKGDSGHRLKEDTGGSLASDSMSRSLFQHAEEVMDGPTDLESQPNVEPLMPRNSTGPEIQPNVEPLMSMDPTGLESRPNVGPLMSMDTGINLSADTPDFVSEVGRLQQEVTLQDEPERNYVVAPTGVQLLKQEDTLEAKKAECMVQAENTTDVSKKKKNKKKKLKDTNTVELLKPEDLISNDSEGNRDFSARRDDEGNAGSIETCSLRIEDPTSKDLNPSPVEVDSRVVDSLGSDSLVTCSAVEYLLDVIQGKKEVPVKYSQEERIFIKEKKELKRLPPSDKVAVSRKRVSEGKDHLLKDSSTKNKKMRSVIMDTTPAGVQGKDGAKQHEALIKKSEGSATPQDLHEGFMSVTAEPLDVHHTGAEGSNASVEDTDAAVPEVNNRTGPFDLVREDAMVSTDGGDSSFEAETSKVEDFRTEKDGAQEVLEGRKGTEEEDSLTTPSKPLKKSVSFSKKILSSSISLRPAFEAKIPMRGSKEVLNRFGQRVPRRLDEPERIGNYPSRIKNGTEERTLMVTFPQGFHLPSESQLREVFAKFGDLNVPLTRIDSKSGCARIIFRRTQDAEVALSSMKETPIYKNARFWLKPKNADVGELSKQSSKYSSSAERPVLSHSNKVEATSASDKKETKTALDKRVGVSTESDIASDRHIQVADRGTVPHNSCSRKKAYDCRKEVAHVSSQSKCRVKNTQPLLSMPHNSCSRKADDGGREGVHVSLQSECGVKNMQPLLFGTSALKKAPVGAGHENLEGTLSDRQTPAASSSCLPIVGPTTLDPPVAIDISEPFLDLLHQLHDVVGKMGFKF